MTEREKMIEAGFGHDTIEVNVRDDAEAEARLKELQGGKR